MTDRKHIDPTIYTTRPTDERLEKENRVYDLLEELSIPFVRIDHDAMNTIDECQDVDKFLGVEICKNLFLCNSQKTKFYLLMMPGHKKFVTRDFCKQINSSRLSFAPPEYMEAYLDLTPGSASILGLMNDHEHHVQLVMDQEVVDQPLIGCHPCHQHFQPHIGHQRRSEQVSAVYEPRRSLRQSLSILFMHTA